MFSNSTLTEVHKEWNDVLAELVDLAVASTTAPTPVTKPRVTFPLQEETLAYAKKEWHHADDEDKVDKVAKWMQEG